MCSAESFLYHPIFRLQFNQGNICIPELWKLQSFLSLFPVRKQRNGSCYTLIYAQPLKHFVRLQSSLRKKIYRLRRIAVCYSVIITITLLSIFGWTLFWQQLKPFYFHYFLICVFLAKLLLLYK